MQEESSIQPSIEASTVTRRHYPLTFIITCLSGAQDAISVAETWILTSLPCSSTWEDLFKFKA